MNRVLVIDDDPLFRTLVCGTLKGDYTVSPASDGHEGYQLAVGARPSVVVLDLLMPTWDGVQTLRAFRADAVLRDVPVIVLTASMDSEELAEAKQLGIAGVHSKCEFNRERLVAQVADEIARSEAPKPHNRPASERAIPVSAQRFNG